MERQSGTGLMRVKKSNETLILDVIMNKESEKSQACEPIILTVRELEILTLLAKGFSTQRAADKLYLSPHTIHTHRKSIIKKLGIKSPTEFVLYAIEFGLILINRWPQG